MKSYLVRPALQREIIAMLSEGDTVGEIAEKTKYKHSSIETFILRMRREHGARNVTHLVHIWNKQTQ